MFTEHNQFPNWDWFVKGLIFNIPDKTLANDILSNSAYSNFLFVSFLLLLLGACTTIPVDERNQIRGEVIQIAETTIAQLVADDPDIQERLDSSVGYAVASLSATKIPVVGFQLGHQQTPVMVCGIQWVYWFSRYLYNFNQLEVLSKQDLFDYFSGINVAMT